jgi:methylenetetrahydrofolate dehydrogenase (NADP+)/methenyltetrahydrofolate cyclohydrolase
MGKVIDGKEIAKKYSLFLKKEFSKIDIKKDIGVFVVGENKATESFVKIKKEMAEKIGVGLIVFRYEESVLESVFLEDFLQKQKEVEGVIVQLPLPESWKKEKILKKIETKKDVDLLNPVNINNFERGLLAGLFPPVAGAVKKILEEESFDIENKKVSIVGIGKLTGEPVYHFLKNNIKFNSKEFNFILEETKKKQRDEILKNSDLIISGVGFPNLIKKEEIKEGVFLIDMGTSSVKKTLVGDIELDCLEKASFFAKTPGGVGPLTVIVLFENFLNLMKGR